MASLMVYPVPTKKAMTTGHSSITVSLGMEEMPSQSAPVQRLKVAILPLNLTCSGPITHSWDISITGKSHNKELVGSSKDDTEMKKVSQFKYAACYMVMMVIILSHYLLIYKSECVCVCLYVCMFKINN
jgi:hypothetical protein